MIPLATTADLAQLECLRPLLAGRACLVVGSAPLQTSHVAVQSDECVIVVNGGISSVIDPPDLWFVNSKQQDAPGSPLLRPLHRAMIEQATNRRVRHVVFLRGSKVASEDGTLARLASLCCRFESWSLLDKPTKVWLEVELCARNANERNPCSAGLLAVATAFYCGAASVRMDGFSWTRGHHYTLPEPVPFRGHEVADKRALKALARRYGDRLQSDLLKKARAA